MTQTPSFDFPTNPSVGDIYQPTGSDISYYWTGTTWNATISGTGAGVTLVTAGDGLATQPSDGITSTGTIAVNNTVIRNAGNQTITGNLTATNFIGGVQSDAVSITNGGVAVGSLTAPNNSLTISALAAATEIDVVLAADKSINIGADPAAPTIELDGDGSAAFDGIVTTNVGLTATKTGTGSVEVAGPSAVWGLQVSDTGNRTFGVGYDGNAEFAGDVTIGDTNTGTFKTDNLTAVRNYQLPNANGTVALVSDVTGGAVEFVGSVDITGTAPTTPLGGVWVNDTAGNANASFTGLNEQFIALNQLVFLTDSNGWVAGGITDVNTYVTIGTNQIISGQKSFSDAVKVGGTLPTTPNINLATDGEILSGSASTQQVRIAPVGTGANARAIITSRNPASATGTLNTFNVEQDGVETMRITVDGSVKIGGNPSTAPNIKLSPDGTSQFSDLMEVGDYDANNNTGTATFVNPNGSLGVRPAAANTDNVLSVVPTGLGTSTCAIRADGSATFAGGDGNTTNNSLGISSTGLLSIRKDTATDTAINIYRGGSTAGNLTFKIAGNGDTEIGGGNINLQANGNSYFAQSTVVAESSGGNGVLTIKNNADPKVTTITLNGDGGTGTFAGDLEVTNSSISTGSNTNSWGVALSPNAGQTGGASYGNITIQGDSRATQTNNVLSVFSGNTENVSVELGGKAVFAGQVWSGGNPFGGAATGSKLTDTGVVVASSTPGTNTVFAGFLTGNADATSTILASGDALFEGNVASRSIFSANPSSNADATGFEVYQASVGSQSGATLKAVWTNVGDIRIGGTLTGANKAPNVEITNAGSASFAGTIDVGDATAPKVQINAGGVVTVTREDSVPDLTQCFSCGKESTPNQARIYADGSADFSSQNIQLIADGSAIFQGVITADGYSLANLATLP